jgi:hypothetical protein
MLLFPLAPADLNQEAHYTEDPMFQHTSMAAALKAAPLAAKMPLPAARTTKQMRAVERGLNTAPKTEVARRAQTTSPPPSTAYLIRSQVLWRNCIPSATCSLSITAFSAARGSTSARGRCPSNTPPTPSTRKRLQRIRWCLTSLRKAT